MCLLSSQTNTLSASIMPFYFLYSDALLYSRTLQPRKERSPGTRQFLDNNTPASVPFIFKPANPEPRPPRPDHRYQALTLWASIPQSHSRVRYQRAQTTPVPQGLLKLLKLGSLAHSFLRKPQYRLLPTFSPQSFCLLTTRCFPWWPPHQTWCAPSSWEPSVINHLSSGSSLLTC